MLPLFFCAGVCLFAMVWGMLCKNDKHSIIIIIMCSGIIPMLPAVKLKTGTKIIWIWIWICTQTHAYTYGGAAQLEVGNLGTCFLALGFALQPVAVPAILSYCPHPNSSTLDGHTLRQNWVIYVDTPIWIHSTVLSSTNLNLSLLSSYPVRWACTCSRVILL